MAVNLRKSGARDEAQFLYRAVNGHCDGTLNDGDLRVRNCYRRPRICIRDSDDGL